MPAAGAAAVVVDITGPTIAPFASVVRSPAAKTSHAAGIPGEPVRVSAVLALNPVTPVT